jgi:DNA-binding transcriptional MocR family regulator
MERMRADLLYEAVADDISSMISAGILLPGQRIPSVRRLSSQRRISVTTVLQAYHVLENRGLIAARPQSGFYVRRDVPRQAEEPSLTRPPRAARPVNVHALVSRVLKDRGWNELVPFGASMPHPDLVPTGRLRRILSSVMRRHPNALATYSFPPGHESLRRQIALRLRDWGVRATADEIIITNGCIEALNLCLRAVARPGDVIALESPTYYALLQIIESLGMKALEIPTHPRDGISLDALALAIEREKVKACVLMPTVSNPLGSTMPDGAKKRAVKMLAERDIPLIEDCVYNALHFGNPAPFAAKAYDRKGGVMLCSSFSKTFAPGFRLGWAVPGRHAARVRTLKFVNTIGVPDVLQLAATEFLANGGYDRLLRKVRRIYARQIELVKAAVARHFPPKTQVTRPSGGFVLWVVMPDGVDAMELYEHGIRENIGLAPGPMFSSSSRYRNCMRINCGMPWSEQSERALARIGELACKQLERSRQLQP